MLIHVYTYSKREWAPPPPLFGHVPNEIGQGNYLTPMSTQKPILNHEDSKIYKKKKEKEVKLKNITYVLVTSYALSVVLILSL